MKKIVSTESKKIIFFCADMCTEQNIVAVSIDRTLQIETTRIQHIKISYNARLQRHDF